MAPLIRCRPTGGSHGQPAARRGLIASFGLAMVAALTACTSGDPPSLSPPSNGHAGTAPPSTVTGGPAGSPSTGAGTPASWPELPAVARAHTPAGAEAFARYYFTARNYAWTRPDPTILTAISERGCKTCVNDVGFAAELQSRHQRYGGAPGERRHVTAGQREVDPAAGRDARVAIQEPVVSWTRRGMWSRPTPEAAAIFRASLDWTPTGWRMRELYISEVGQVTESLANDGADPGWPWLPPRSGPWSARPRPNRQAPGIPTSALVLKVTALELAEGPRWAVTGRASRPGEVRSSSASRRRSGG